MKRGFGGLSSAADASQHSTMIEMLDILVSGTADDNSGDPDVLKEKKKKNGERLLEILSSAKDDMDSKSDNHPQSITKRRHVLHQATSSASAGQPDLHEKKNRGYFNNSKQQLESTSDHRPRRDPGKSGTNTGTSLLSDHASLSNPSRGRKDSSVVDDTNRNVSSGNTNTSHLSGSSSRRNGPASMSTTTTITTSGVRNLSEFINQESPPRR